MVKQIRRGFISFYRFIKLVFQQFFANDGIYRASALSFTTLLSIVPLMSVALTVLSIFPEYDDFKKPIQDFIFQNFVPTTSETIQTYLEKFTQQASQLSLFGLLFLVITAIMLIYTIEQAMNQIWRVKIPRGSMQAFFLYWAVLTLAPLLIGLSLIFTSYIMALPMLHNSILIHARGYSHFISWAPFMLSLMAFTLLYVGIPNRQVRFLHGFTGAFLAAILFELAKIGFAYYLTRFDTYETLYGAFAVVPIFFVWIYTVWTIILIGAEVAHAISIQHERRSADKLDGFSHSIQWLGYLYDAQVQGAGLSQTALIAKDNCNYQVAPDDLLAKLIDSRLVHVTAVGEYVLGCDLSTLSLAELFCRLPWKVPMTIAAREVSPQLEVILEKLEKSHEIVLSQKAMVLFQ